MKKHAPVLRLAHDPQWRRRLLRLVYDADAYARPATRGDCQGGARPCRYVACKYHLQHDVNPSTGSIKVNFPEIKAMTETCALDVADRGGALLDEVGQVMNLTRERVRQIEESALRKLRGRWVE
jgi:hypothetical protein